MILFLFNNSVYISLEIIHQREPPPSMSELDEIETEINGPQGMDQNDVEGEVQQVQIAEESGMFWSPLNFRDL